METAAKALEYVQVFTETADPYLDLIDDQESDFLKAFCELLEIQSRRNTAPIVLWPRGPSVLH